MDFDRTFQAPVIVVFGDGEGDKVPFPRLTCDDLAVYQAEIKARKYADAQALAKEAGLPPKEKYAALADAKRTVTHLEVWDWAISPEGSRRVLHDALTKANLDKPARDALIARVNSAEHVDLVEQITGYYIIGDKARAESEKQKAENAKRAAGDKAAGEEGFRPLTGEAT